MQMVSVPTMPRIDIYSHHFVLTRMDDRCRRACEAFTANLIEWDTVRIPPFTGKARYARIPIRIYATSNQARTEFRALKSQLENFKAQMYANGVNPDTGIEYVVHELYEPDRIVLVSKSGKELRPEQIPVVDYLSALDDNRSKVVTAPTGSGKTLMSLRALERMGMRTVVVIKSEYIDSKWVLDVEEELVMQKGDLMVVKGSDALISLMNLGLSHELKAKIIIIGNRTFQNYLRSYERDTFFSEMYPTAPIDFYKSLRAGVRVIDEVHQDFHLNVKQDAYTHIPYTFSLSATLDADQEILNTMYRLMWPIGTRGPTIQQKKYIEATCLWYNAEQPYRLRYLNHKKQYGHVLLEQSIMKNRDLLAKYLRMIEVVVQTKIVDYVKGQKMLIFCSTIDMCTLVKEYLAPKFPQFSVSRYTGEDSKECLYDHDIVVTTLKSAGTAIDLPDLRWVIMTVALSNKQANIQVLGRLRELKNYPGTEPEFMFFACRQIGKHVEYAMSKKAKLDSKVKSFHQSNLPVGL